MLTRTRRAESRDAEELTRIYNYYVLETPITFDVEPWTLEQRREWLADFAADGRHQCFVAEVEGRVVGWACTRPFRPKAAYETSAETSIYVDRDFHGRGLGRRLYETLFDGIKGQDLRRALAGVTLPNAASIALHRQFGFERVGVFSEVGRKFGRYWDVEWLEKAL
jgi:phosphinothricin acetyltransferase